MLNLLLVAMLLPALGAARSAARMQVEMEQLRQIGAGYAAWAIENKDTLPDHAADLLPYLGDESLYIAPPDGPGAFALVKSEDKPAEPYVYGSFDFMPTSGITISQINQPSRLVLAYSAEPRGPGDRYVAAPFADGHVEQMELNGFEQACQETLAWLGVSVGDEDETLE